jgi:hypothetical protein
MTPCFQRYWPMNEKNANGDRARTLTLTAAEYTPSIPIPFLPQLHQHIAVAHVVVSARSI